MRNPKLAHILVLYLAIKLWAKLANRETLLARHNFLQIYCLSSNPIPGIPFILRFALQRPGLFPDIIF